MNDLLWPLTVLSRAISHKNLSAASQQIGLSQPQLSRLIKQLETELDLVLLDRTAPRHTSWTPEARQLAEIFIKNQKSLSSHIQNLQKNASLKEVTMGCLEGLATIGIQMSGQLMEQGGVEVVTLDILDQNELEAKFLLADLDFIITSRSPSNRKYQRHLQVGYQQLKRVQSSQSDIQILSSYEFESLRAAQKSKKKGRRRLVSNSLFVRQSFFKTYGGQWTDPGPVFTEKGPENSSPVLILGQDTLPDKLWECVTKVTYTQNLNK